MTEIWDDADESDEAIQESEKQGHNARGGQWLGKQSLSNGRFAVVLGD